MSFYITKLANQFLNQRTKFLNKQYYCLCSPSINLEIPASSTWLVTKTHSIRWDNFWLKIPAKWALSISNAVLSLSWYQQKMEAVIERIKVLHLKMLYLQYYSRYIMHKQDLIHKNKAKLSKDHIKVTFKLLISNEQISSLSIRCSA